MQSIQPAVKRILDIIIAGTALVLLIPVLIACGTAIRLDSPGPILYRQQRVGRYGRLFRINKFRTMQDDAGQRGLQVTTNLDPRITRVGHFLRKTKLDEIPQLVNVLAGDMSVVGPRPEVPKYVAFYPPAAREKILSVRPGITDLASIRFIDENAMLASADDPERAYIETVLPSKVKYYLEYVDQQSVCLDLRIIARTIRALIRA